MVNKLDEYDTNKLKAARKLIYDVYGHSWPPNTPLTKKLETVLKKLDNIMENEREEQI